MATIVDTLIEHVDPVNRMLSMIEDTMLDNDHSLLEMQHSMFVNLVFVSDLVLELDNNSSYFDDECRP